MIRYPRNHPKFTQTEYEKRHEVEYFDVSMAITDTLAEWTKFRAWKCASPYTGAGGTLFTLHANNWRAFWNLIGASCDISVMFIPNEYVAIRYKNSEHMNLAVELAEHLEARIAPRFPRIDISIRHKPNL